MPDVIPIPDGLTKHERRKFIKEWQRQKREKRQRRQKYVKLTVLGIVILLTIGGIYFSFKKITQPLPGQFVPSLGNQHIESTATPHEQYNSLPPTSGPHVGGKAEWGIHDKPIPDELQIHNLEDGGVVVQYNCTPGEDTSADSTESAKVTDECKQLITQLTEAVNKYKDKVVLAPYPKLDTKIALTAWTRIDKFNEFEKERVVKFIDAFRGIDHHKG